MGKEITSKGRVIDDAFRREAVRILATSGRTIKAVATDLGIGIHPGFRRCVRRSVPGELKNMGLLRQHVEKRGYAQSVRGIEIDGDAKRRR